MICKFLFDTYKDGDDPTVGERERKISIEIFVICTVNFDKLSNAIIQPFVEDSYIQNSFTVDNIQYKLEIVSYSFFEFLNKSIQGLIFNSWIPREMIAIQISIER